MSFILDALKKSENKHRKKGEPGPRTIYEPVSRNGTRLHPRLVLILILLVIGTAFLFWFLGSRQRTSPLPTTEISSVGMAQKKTKEFTANSSQTVTPTRHNNIVQRPSDTQEPPVDIKQQVEMTKPLSVPRNEKQVYRFGQLPVSIQKRIPPLRMSLHAYNRSDASSSMVQLNDKIMHEGDAVTDTIRLEKISADGAILRYDGYRFLLPRQGN